MMCDAVRVLAARFDDQRVALGVRASLLRQLDLDPADLEIAPLGIPGQPATSDTLLAGRFADDEADTALEAIRSAGGEIVADVDETWTRPRPFFVRHRVHA